MRQARSTLQEKRKRGLKALLPEAMSMIRIA
jgi:hypothetical protein